MREFSDLRPFDDIPVSFFQISGVVADFAAGRGLFSFPPKTSRGIDLTDPMCGKHLVSNKTDARTIGDSTG